MYETLPEKPRRRSIGEKVELSDQDIREALEQSTVIGKLSKQNLSDLTAIREAIFFEEGNETVTLDEALSRVLQFYRKFVPYT
jgi:hypothetical protein